MGVMKDYANLPVNKLQLLQSMAWLVFVKNDLHHEINDRLKKIEKLIDKYNIQNKLIESIQAEQTAILCEVERINFEIAGIR